MKKNTLQNDALENTRELLKTVPKKTFKHQFLLGGAVGILSVSALAGVTFYSASAHGGESGPRLETRSAVKQAVENNDYAQWKELVGDKKIGKIIDSEEKFLMLSQMHDLRSDGKHEEAQKIHDQLGLPQRLHRMHRMHSNEAVQTALKNNDFSAWQEAVKNRPIAEKVTKEDFSKMVELHNFREGVEHQKANKIRKELGFGHHGHMMMDHDHGQK